MSDRPLPQDGEQLLGEIVRQLADQHIARRRQRRYQIGGRPEIGRKHHAPCAARDIQAENLEAPRRRRVETLVQTVQVGRGKDPDLHPGSRLDLLRHVPRMQLKREPQQRRRQIHRIKPSEQRFDQFAGQVNRQRPLSRCEPCGLQQHGQTADVIRVAMRNQHGIQVRHRNARFRQTLAAGLTRINQHPRLATLQKTRGTKPPTHRRAGSRAEEKQGIHKLCTSPAAAPEQADRAGPTLQILTLQVYTQRPLQPLYAPASAPVGDAAKVGEGVRHFPTCSADGFDMPVGKRDAAG